MFRKQNLEKSVVYLLVSYPAIASAAMLAAYMNKSGTSGEKFRGGFLYDPVARFERRGSIPADFSKVFNLLARHIEFCEKEFPQAVQFTVDATVYSNAGASACQELAFALAKSAFIFNSLIACSVPAGVLARKMTLSLSVGQNFLMEIARFALPAFFGHNSAGIRHWRKRLQNCNPCIFVKNQQNETRRIQQHFKIDNRMRGSNHCRRRCNPSPAIRRAVRVARGILAPDHTKHLQRACRGMQPARCNRSGRRIVGGRIPDEELATRSWELFQSIERSGGFLET
jgi:hypothetical protein